MQCAQTRLDEEATITLEINIHLQICTSGYSDYRDKRRYFVVHQLKKLAFTKFEGTPPLVMNTKTQKDSVLLIRKNVALVKAS